MNKIINAYARFLSEHPVLIFIIMLSLTIGAIDQAQHVDIGESDFKDFFPNDLEVIKALDDIENAFGSTDQANYVIYLDPNNIDSNEPRDIRDPKILEYAKLLGDYASHVEDVTRVMSPIDYYEEIPKTLNEAKLAHTPLINNYISNDKTVLLIKIRISDTADNMIIRKELSQVLDNIEPPTGVKVQLAGVAMEDPAINDIISKDMSKTSTYSLLGILIAMLLLFMSLKYGLLPLTTIVFGLIWTFGYLGISGINITSSTSGVVSMIMGIGIDFGIQVSNRFKQELAKNKKQKAMEITLDKVLMPMFITTCAAVIGFTAMSFGQLTFLAEMGEIMSYGVIGCFFAAITVVPSALLILTKNNTKNIKKKVKS